MRTGKMGRSHVCDKHWASPHELFSQCFYRGGGGGGGRFWVFLVKYSYSIPTNYSVTTN